MREGSLSQSLTGCGGPAKPGQPVTHLGEPRPHRPLDSGLPGANSSYSPRFGQPLGPAANLGRGALTAQGGSSPCSLPPGF